MDRKRKPGFRIISVFLSIVIMLTGCGETAATEEVQTDYKLSMEETPYLEYLVPRMEPGVLVDLRGYSAAGNKKIIMRGEALPGEFRVVDADTGQVVYTGEVKQKGYHDDREEYNSYGTFSEFLQEGEYYIECDRIGRSHNFLIQADLYEQVLQEALGELVIIPVTVSEDGSASLSREEQASWMLQIIILLLSYELYPDVFADDNEDQIPDIMEILAVMIKELSNLQDTKTGSAGELNYTYAAALAKFSYLYQKYDNVYATEILNLADKAWRYAEGIRKNQTGTDEASGNGDEAYRMLAAAELYRAAGQSKYGNVITQYQGSSASVSGNELPIEENKMEETLAKMTYISTKRKVNLSLCSQFMRELMLEAEETAARAGNSLYLSASDVDNDGMDKLIWDIIQLSVVEYVIYNNEYGQVIDNQYHYLMGVNPDAYCYFSSGITGEAGIRIQDNPVWLAGFVMVLSVIITKN